MIIQDINGHCSKELYVMNKKQAEILEIAKPKFMSIDTSNQKKEYHN